MFSQKTQDLKPHNILKNHSQNFQQPHFYLLSTAADMQPLTQQQSWSYPCKAPETGQLQLFPITHTPERGKNPKKSDKAVTSY